MRSLSGYLDKVTDQVRQSRKLGLPAPDLTVSDSVVFSLIEDLLLEVVSTECRMPGTTRQCHHCHRPLKHPDHAGVGSGVKQCTLSHYELCPGGRVSGPDWTGCPDECTTTDSEEGEESTMMKMAADDPESIKVNKSVTVIDDSNLDLNTCDPYGVVKTLLEEVKITESVVGGTDSDSSDEEDRILQSEIEALKTKVQNNEAKHKAERKEKKRLNRERLEREKAELLRKSKAQQQFPVKTKVTAPKDTSASYGLHKKADELASKQQQEAAIRRSASQNRSDNLTIGNIRSLPGASTEVERILVGLQALIPSLAKTPSAPSASGSTFQPSGVTAVQPGQVGEEYDTDFVFHAGRGKFVPVVHSPSPSNHCPGKQQMQFGGGNLREDETSADEDCEVEPPPGYRLVWKRDDSGEKYFVEKKVKQCAREEMIQTYVCDEDTGRWYKRSISKTEFEKLQPAKTIAKKTPASVPASSGPYYKDHRVESSSPVPLVKRGQRTPVAAGLPPCSDRLPGIVPIDPEKQGRDNKLPDRVQWARNCPVNWTNKVTSANMNVVLWAWSSIAELLATRSGMAPNLEPGELEARLQHFCHVLEITLQTSVQSDFCGDAWAVAHLYDRKVQQKVDSKMFTWVQLSTMNHGASMPHELIAATQELAKKPKEVVKGNEGRRLQGNGKGNGGKKEKATWKCPTWNRSETRGKCNWEVENAPSKCQGVHECNWCKSKSFTPVDHQRFFCQKRLAEER